MTDDAKSQAAWQDVEQVLQQEPNLHVLKILIADARAADAQQIAELQVRLEDLRLISAQQIAALRAEKEQLQQQLEETYVAALNRERTKTEAAEAQLTALQAEQAQWQQQRWPREPYANTLRQAGLALTPAQIHGVTTLTAELFEKLLAALTAQQDGSLPTRQPKP